MVCHLLDVYKRQDTTTLYCTEFVALAYCATEIPAYQVQPTGHNVAIPFPYYTLDDLIKTIHPLHIRN